MDWFKFHHDALNNPKVQRLTGDQFKAWVNLLCLSSQRQERGALPCVADCAFALRLDEGECAEIMDKLETFGLLEFDEETECYCIHHWKECQYDKPSDYPENVAERVRKSRERRRNADVTPGNALDTDTDTEQIQTQKRTLTADNPPKEPKYTEEFESFWSMYPRKTAKYTAFVAWQKIRPGPEVCGAIAQALSWQRDGWSDPKFVPHPATWLNQRRWEDERPQVVAGANGRASPKLSNYEISMANIRAALGESDPVIETTGVLR